MGEVQGQGYIGQVLGYVDVFVIVFSYVMIYCLEDFEWEGCDCFLFFYGYYVIVYYVVLLEVGIILEVELEIYGFDDSCLLMFGMVIYILGMEMFGGLLGQGLFIVVGMVFGLWQKQSKVWVYNFMFDGELDEGLIWEVVMLVVYYGLSNLINFVDVNKQQVDGDLCKIFGFELLQDKWVVFGWYVQCVDGNDLLVVMVVFDNVKSYFGNQLWVILCDMLMGKGVLFFEICDKNYFICVDVDEW